MAARVTVEIDVKRDGWRLLLSTFIGFALAIALAEIVLTTEFSLADAFRLTAFSVTCLTMLSVLAVLVMRERKREVAALWIGRILFALYVTIVALIIHRVFGAVGA